MKHALITLGNEDYGLSFVGGELLEHGQEIRFFDGENGAFREVTEWKPDFIMFSPLTTFYPKALKLAEMFKRSRGDVRIVFGGHHALADSTILKNHCIDTVVVGPVRGSVERILSGETGLIRTSPTYSSDLPKPARAEYYRDIERVGKRYRKFLLSVLGCPWNCSYCSAAASQVSRLFGHHKHKDYFLTHRPVEDVIAEAKEVAKHDTHEIEFVDDDIFAGNEKWLMEFIKQWEANFSGWYIDPYGPDVKYSLPMYISTTSHSVVTASDKLLKAFQPYVSAVGLGVQAIRPESLKLFNRQWDSEAKIQSAYDRLINLGYRVNLQFIVGLPVSDPVGDAIDTLLAVKRIGPGSICSCYPLQVYPGTKIEQYCKDNDIELNPDCKGDTNSAVCGVKFLPHIEKQLHNICKLATFFVKYDMDERLIRALIKCDFDMDVSQELSMLRYKECVVDRLGPKGERIFEEILSTMNLRF
jgi:radical SAM superfamily enzyme YgiQ (UPF0313 family)